MIGDIRLVNTAAAVVFVRLIVVDNSCKPLFGIPTNPLGRIMYNLFANIDIQITVTIALNSSYVELVLSNRNDI